MPPSSRARCTHAKHPRRASSTYRQRLKFPPRVQCLRGSGIMEEWRQTAPTPPPLPNSIRWRSSCCSTRTCGRSPLSTTERCAPTHHSTAPRSDRCGSQPATTTAMRYCDTRTLPSLRLGSPKIPNQAPLATTREARSYSVDGTVMLTPPHRSRSFVSTLLTTHDSGASSVAGSRPAESSSCGQPLRP